MMVLLSDQWCDASVFGGYMRLPGNNRTLAAVFVLLLATSLPHFAQTVTGRILGTVHDPSGAALANANVTVTDTQRGLTRTVATDPSGNFVAASLTPGIYTVRAEAKGFKTVERQNVQVEVARDLAIDLTLTPGEVQQTVVVSGEIPLVDTVTSTLGGTLSNVEINDLPLNGRNYENLLQLRPGVIRYPGGGFSTTSANGLRAEDNAYLVDGLFNSEPYSGQAIINGAGIAGDSATILPVDSIQEFNLQQNPPAEYGWKPGAIVNVGLKSGTNSVHGTAFAFGRYGGLDARNYFNTKPDPKPGRELEQFGGSVGGPIVKNKVFFFGAYERQQYTVGNSFGGITSPSMVPMATNGTCLFVATGDCADSIPDAINDLLHYPSALGIGVSPASMKVADCTLSGSGVTCAGKGFPLNNNPTINIPNGFNNDVHADNLVGKVDVRPTSSHSFGGTYFFGNNSGIVEDFPELQANWRSIIHTRAQVGSGNWVWIPNPRWVNEARFGYSRLYQPTLPADVGTPASAYGLITGVSGPFTGGLPRISFGGYFFPGLGGFKWPKFQGPDSITQFVDHVSYLTGQHSIKFGGELHRNNVTNAAYGNSRGGIKFLGGGAYTSPTDPNVMSTSLEDFLAGAPTVASVEVGDPTVHLHNWQYSAFFQDDWRLARNLTLNFGVRYEYSSVPQETHNLLGNFDPALGGMVQVGKQISNVYNPDHKNFAPRVGFAWDVSGNGRTVVRGGAGLTYETVNWQSFIAFNNSYGLGSVPTGATLDGVPGPGTITTGNIKVFPNVPWDNGPIYGNISSGSLSCTVDNPCAIMTVDRKLTTPYVWTWTLNLQHAFTPTLSTQIAYVGNHGTNLTGIRDINQAALGIDFSNTCTADPNCEQHSRPYGTATGNPSGKAFDYLSNIFQMGNVYRSNYNGLQATLNARNFHGLTMVAGYTYSHSLDDLGANWDFGAGYGLPQDSTKAGLAKEYANSDFDIRHRLTISFTYAIPGRKGAAQMLEGWEVNTIATIESAQPWGPIDLTSGIAGIGQLPVNPPQATPMRWNFYGKPSDFKSGPSGIPFFGGKSNAACAAKALSLDGGNVGGPADLSLASFGCYVVGSSMMLPPPQGQFGTMGRNTFRDSGFRNLDFSLAKNWHFGERWRAQFRAEFFNILNHPNFANPYGGQNGFGLNDPAAGGFGCGCATPDVAAANPVIGSGGSRAVQLGLKFTF
jgi:hypothetical protein